MSFMGGADQIADLKNETARLQAVTTDLQNNISDLVRKLLATKASMPMNIFYHRRRRLQLWKVRRSCSKNMPLRLRRRRATWRLW
jgi:predicted  nucleic acid-binding Zn-ribbon protein